MKFKTITYLLLFLICLVGKVKCQGIANYVTNGGFENLYSCSGLNSLNTCKYWRSIDSNIFAATKCYNVCYGNVPFGLTFQFPRTGNGFILSSFLCQPPQCSSTNNRGYLRNRLKANLAAGKIYCVKFYINVANNSTYAIDSYGALFSDNNSLDTITKPEIPLVYFTPQIQNPLGNIITDTLNWTLITGTFVANGTEKNCVIGNFKSDAATNKTFINSAFLPLIFSDACIDDVSCIPIDLPAYAGADIWAIPGNTVYIGRPQDVGIDEACTWYNLTNTTTPVANAAGFSLTVSAVTATYMVKQDICGIIKYDTVVVHASVLGLVTLSGVEALNVNLFPNPANEILSIHISTSLNMTEKLKIKMYNSLGQMIREEVLRQAQQPDGSCIAEINTKDLENGVYVLKLSSQGTRDLNTYPSYRQDDNQLIASKRFVIAR